MKEKIKLLSDKMKEINSGFSVSYNYDVDTNSNIIMLICNTLLGANILATIVETDGICSLSITEDNSIMVNLNRDDIIEFFDYYLKNIYAQ